MGLSRVMFTWIVTCAVLNAVTCSPTLQISVASDELYVGDSVRITCAISGTESSGWMLRWIKHNPGSTDDIDMATNIYPSGVYINPRYSFTTDIDPGAVAPPSSMEFYLDITDLQPSDSGSIGCIVTESLMRDFVNLNVIVDIQHLEMGSQPYDSQDETSVQVITENSTLVYDEGQHVRFWCTAAGSYPAAHLQMFLDDQNFTDSFVRREELVENTDMSSYSYRVTLEIARLQINYIADRKPFECKATVPGQSRFHKQTITALVLLNEYPPQFMCDERPSAYANQRNFTITCVVFGNPGVVRADVSWDEEATDDGDGDDGSQSNAIDNAGKQYAVNIRMLTQVETQVSIVFDRVLPEYFGTFTLTAENSQGHTATHLITLTEMMRITTPTPTTPAGKKPANNADGNVDELTEHNAGYCEVAVSAAVTLIMSLAACVVNSL